MTHLKKIAASVGAAFALGYATFGVAAVDNTPAAIADAMLKFTNFSFTSGGQPLCSQDPVANQGVCRTDGAGNPTLFITNGAEFASGSAALGSLAVPNSIGNAAQGTGVTGVPLGSDFTVLGGVQYPGAPAVVGGIQVNGVGPFPTGPAGFTPGTAHNSNVISDTFAGFMSQSIGNSLLGTASVVIQSTVSLAHDDKDGHADSQQNLSTEFILTPLIAPLTVTLGFDSELFVRAGLGQDGILAKASTSFFVDLVAVNLSTGVENTAFTWTPGTGLTCPLGGCVETIPTYPGGLFGVLPQSLTVNSEVLLKGDSVLTYSGSFDLTATIPVAPAGTVWKFKITGSTQADAGTPTVPEPGTLALLALGLLGVGTVVRRKAGR